jgi:hypothetical protein
LGEILRQALEGCVERSCFFAYFHDGDIQRRENLRVSTETAREIASTLQVLQNFFESFA